MILYRLMLTVHSNSVAIILCTVTMIGWGSWANTQKLAGRTSWPFELYYWDYVIGMVLFSIFFMLTAGSSGATGVPALENLRHASAASMLIAAFSGLLFNIANILLVVAIDAAGMSTAFPIGIGLALIIGTIASYVQRPQGNALVLFAGVAFILAAMIFSALAYRRLPQSQSKRWARGTLFAIVAGCLMGFFYPQLIRSVSPGFTTGSILPGLLTPYTALFFFSIGVLFSNFVVNTFFMKAAGRTYAEYAAGSVRLHSLGVLGGLIWTLAFGLNILASGVAGPAISYALGQGATLIAAIWGVVIWKEFRHASRGTMPLVYCMFAGYVIGLLLIGFASLSS